MGGGALPTHPPVTRNAENAESALAGLPADAPLRDVWLALGRGGVLRGLYEDGRVRAARLGELLRAVDARGDNGVTLGVLVQTASALPLLGGEGGEVYEWALAGEAVVALAATDADAAGSDLAGLGTEVAIEGERLTLNGGKRWITGALAADRLLVLARHRPGRHFTSFAWVLVPADAPGVTVRPAATDLLAG
ncbi:acyl-CoA dehydrogenase family protein, partial [Streptomyces sp. NPDC049577]|uniref:acyl-CoA dehydrogenase family protein n=1 Tax=Streptomyces sp. NPDC049577 TaxID=3155153 RepID=UPI003424E7F0